MYLHLKVRRALVTVGVVLISISLAGGVGFAQGKKKKPPAPRLHPKKLDFVTEVAKLRGTDHKAAERAAVNLGRIKNKRVVPELLEVLALGVHPKVAAAALGALAKHKDIAGYTTIVRYTRHRDGRVRAAAVHAMGALDDARAVGFVLAALHDGRKEVRAAAIEVIRDRTIKQGIEPMLVLLKKGDEATAKALAFMADPDLARVIGELIGTAPDALLARCLGMILMKPSFKPETARVQVVRALGKVPGGEAIEQLTAYMEAIPEKPPRQSRREAEALIELRLTGGN